MSETDVIDHYSRPSGKMSETDLIDHLIKKQNLGMEYTKPKYGIN